VPPQGSDKGIIPRTVEDIFYHIAHDPSPDKCARAPA
jgi:hypothetical protein